MVWNVCLSASPSKIISHEVYICICWDILTFQILLRPFWHQFWYSSHQCTRSWYLILDFGWEDWFVRPWWLDVLVSMSSRTRGFERNFLVSNSCSRPYCLWNCGREMEKAFKEQSHRWHRTQQLRLDTHPRLILFKLVKKQVRIFAQSFHPSTETCAPW